MLFVILFPPNIKEDGNGQKNAEKHNEDIKIQRTSILGIIKQS